MYHLEFIKCEILLYIDYLIPSTCVFFLTSMSLLSLAFAKILAKQLHSSNPWWFSWISVSNNGSIIPIWKCCFPSLLRWWGAAKAYNLVFRCVGIFISLQHTKSFSLGEQVNCKGLKIWKTQTAVSVNEIYSAQAAPAKLCILASSWIWLQMH